MSEAETEGEGENKNQEAQETETAPEAEGWEPVDVAAEADGSPEADVIELADARLEARAEVDDEAAGEGGAGGGDPDEGRVPPEQLEGVVESLLFASDKPLGLEDLRSLTGQTDTAALGEAVEALRARRQGSGVEVAEVANGYTLRTRAAFAPWVSKLLAGRPVRLSRAMLEAVAIIAYRQPITRPELDDIRGVDCGPVLKTLLDRGLIRIIGKKEEVGRPILYGTTPEFLRVFSLKDLTQLPTLRQFHELSAEHLATLEAKHGPDPKESAVPPPAAPDPIGSPPPAWAAPIAGAEAFMEPGPSPLARVERDPEALEADADEDSDLLQELESASEAAAKAAQPLNPTSGEAPSES